MSKDRETEDSRNDKKRTEDDVGTELVRDGHDDLLKRVDVIGITHSRIGEGDIDGTVDSCQPSIRATGKRGNPQALACSLPDHLRRTIVSSRVEAVSVSMNGDVKNVWVVPEGFLRTVACEGGA
jgi:hypothetical protein